MDIPLIIEPDPSRNLAWQEKAECLLYPPEMFYRHGSNKKARAVCGQCVVQAKCLEWILEVEKHDRPYGFIGGKSQKERENMRLCIISGCKNYKIQGSTYCSEACKKKGSDLAKARRKEDEYRSA